MGALKIDCFLTESQMENILKRISDHINSFSPRDIEDFDDEINGVRVCVVFDSYLDKIELSESVILDAEEWDELLEDTAVFTSRLNKILKDQNNYNKASLEQSLQIQEDQRSYSYY